MRRVPLPRASSLAMPEVQNPFFHRIHLTTLDKIQVAFMSIFVVPLRLFFVAFWLVMGWALAAVCLAGRTEEEKREPLSGWRKLMRGPMQFIGRAYFFSFGMHRVTFKGEQVSPVVAPILVSGPHSTFFDILIFMCTNELPTGVSRIENGRVPIFGTLTCFTQPVFVSREDPNSRVNTIKEIRERAQTMGKWPQIIIFPEGTCTNRSCLISFKPGAFIPGVPVQPVCLRYSNRMDTTTWTWDGPGAFTILWLTLCNFYTTLEVEFLPPYIPSEDEKNDAKLYANNVRDVMAKALGVPVTDHTFEDCRLMAYAAKLSLPAASGLLEFSKISKKLGMNFDNIKEVLAKYCTMAQKNKGHITIDEFAEYLDLPKSEHLEMLFDLYDRSGSGTIDFREYVIGLHLIAQPANSEDTIKFAFELFDKGEKGYIESSELEDILHRAFGMDSVNAAKLFAQIDADQDGKITYGEFKAYAEVKPEYARLFMDYQAAAELREEEEAALEEAQAAAEQEAAEHNNVNNVHHNNHTAATVAGDKKHD